jgi:hypothetical protein
MNTNETWICEVCHLTQAFAESIVCEMCQTPRTHYVPNQEMTMQPTAHVFIESSDHLKILISESRKRLASYLNFSNEIDMYMTASPETEISSTADRNDSSLIDLESAFPNWDYINDLISLYHHDIISKGNHNDCFYSRGKSMIMLKLEHENYEDAKKWESLHYGWTWVRKHLRDILKEFRLRDINTMKKVIKVMNTMEGNESDDKSCQQWKSRRLNDNVVTIELTPHLTDRRQYDKSPTCCNLNSHVNKEAADVKATAQIRQTFQRALRKLVKQDWILCYESIRKELSLQAQALCADLRSIGSNMIKIDMDRDLMSLCESNDHDIIAQCHYFLQRVLSSCLTFISWVEEMAERCWALNDKIGHDCPQYGRMDHFAIKELYRNNLHMNNLVNDDHRYSKSKSKLKSNAMRGRTTYGEEEEYGSMDKNPLIPSIDELGFHILRSYVLISPNVKQMLEYCIAVLGYDMEYNHRHRQYELSKSSSLLIEFYEMIRIIDLDDNSIACFRNTARLLRDSLIMPIMNMNSLASYIRDNAAKRAQENEALFSS